MRTSAFRPDPAWNHVITDLLDAALRSSLTRLGVEPPATISLERPARAEHGDWSTNVAMATAKSAGRNPRELAQALVDDLMADLPAHVEGAELAGPGFVNFRLRPTWLHEVLRTTVRSGDDLGRSDLGEGCSVLVEFVSANPTGPLHAGHARGAVFGDAVARLLEWSGHRVQREFYINDRGSQMVKMGESIAARAAGEEPPEDGYRGAYIAEWAKGLAAGDDPLEYGYATALADQRQVLESLGVHFDEWFSEREMVGRGEIETTLADLAERGVTYEADGALWLRSTDYGDDTDRVLVKSDGSYTYLLPDIAYHRDKFDRGFDLLLNVWGADHHGYVPRMRAAIEALGHAPDQLEIAITQMVRLMRDGEEVKISKRTGELIELRDILDEVGADATRFTYLLQSVDSPQTVDLGLIVSKSMDNPVFYCQMAYARLCSVDRVAAERGLVRPPLDEVDLSPLTSERELDVLRVLSDLDHVMSVAVRERAPHRVTAWVRELAAAVHGFYHDCPIHKGGVEPSVRDARWWLAAAAATGLRAGLGVLGVTAPTEM
jgi:arginyl-tRNA synthetase